MRAEEPSSTPVPARDYTGLVILGTLIALEIGILYVLIVFDTPLTPLVRRLLRNFAGVFTLVVFIVTFLSMGVAAVLSWRERRQVRRSASDGTG